MYLLIKLGLVMKVAVHNISKSRPLFVNRFCESTKNADFIEITDTGPVG
jgi:hypothetical protein